MNAPTLFNTGPAALQGQDSAGHAQLTAASSQLRASRWKKALDQEQQQIVQKMRSVKSGESSPAGSSDSGLPGAASSARKPALHGALPALSERGKQARPITAPSPVALKGLAPIVNAATRRPAVMPYAWAQPAAVTPPAGATPLEEAVALALADVSPATAEPAGAQAGQASQSWQLQNVHVHADGQGVTVWVRDSRLTANAQATAALVAQLRKHLSASGRQLNALVLNGKEWGESTRAQGSSTSHHEETSSWQSAL